MTNSDVRLLPRCTLFFFGLPPPLLFKLYQFERRRLSPDVHQNELSCFLLLCQSSKVLSGDPAVRPIQAIMYHRLRKPWREALCLSGSGEGLMSKVEKDVLSHLFGHYRRMSNRKAHFYSWVPSRNRLTSTLPWRQVGQDWQSGCT